MFHCHYTCDVCQRVLDPIEDARYLLRISSCADVDGSDARIDDDRDYLEEINDLLECSGDLDDMRRDDDADEPVEYDLCSECRRKFSIETIGSRVVQILEFSEN